MPLTDLQMIIGIVTGILFMIWCVKSQKQPRSIHADKPKEPRPREFKKCMPSRASESLPPTDGKVLDI